MSKKVTIRQDGERWSCTNGTDTFFGESYYLAWRAMQYQDNRMGTAESMRLSPAELGLPKQEPPDIAPVLPPTNGHIKEVGWSTALQVHLQEGAILPTKSYSGDAGLDLYTYGEQFVRGSGITNIATGVSMAMPPGIFGIILPRSSTIETYGLEVIPAVIDNGYRGDMFIRVLDIMRRADGFRIPHGARLAQFIPLPILDFPLVSVDALPPTERGTKGFGSSGK